MEKLFCDVLNMSFTGSLAILGVLIARMGLRKAPKVFSYALWSVVLFRLLCPVSVSVAVPLPEPVERSVEAVTEHTSRVVILQEMTAEAEELPKPVGQQSEPRERSLRPETILAVIWALGAGAMAGFGLFSMIGLKRRLEEAVPVERRVWEADGLDTAFVLGLLRPRIYLPSGLAREERRFVLLHEKCHIRRLDHVVKLASFGALCIHWFNPLVWLAFFLAERDMEMSCDEAVLTKLGEGSRCDYSQTLLRVSSGRRWTTAMPLAFGEGNTKGRVKNVLNWKKPKLWMSVMCLAVCLCVLAACGVNPAGETPQPMESTEPSAPTGQDQTGLEEIQAELEREQSEYEQTRTPVGRSVEVELIGFANLEITLPVDWAYEIVEYTENCDRCGIRFWPEDCPEGSVGLYYHPNGFGVCGTGLETNELTLASGEKASVGYYDGSDAWSFISMEMDYAALAEGTAEWTKEDRDTAMDIVLYAVRNRGVITQGEAMERIRQEGLLEEEWERCRAIFDPEYGFWSFTFYENSYNDPVQTVCVGWDGRCDHPDESHHDHHGT